MGEWIGRCVLGSRELHGGALSPEVFDDLCVEALEVFEAETWSLRAERWVMNAWAHRLDAALLRADVPAAERALVQLTEHGWFDDPDRRPDLDLRRARVDLAAGRVPAAVAGIEAGLFDSEGRVRHPPDTEQLARVWLELGRARAGAGDAAGARQAWEEAVSLTAEAGNHGWQAQAREELGGQ